MVLRHYLHRISGDIRGQRQTNTGKQQRFPPIITISRSGHAQLPSHPSKNPSSSIAILRIRWWWYQSNGKLNPVAAVSRLAPANYWPGELRRVCHVLRIILERNELP